MTREELDMTLEEEEGWSLAEWPLHTDVWSSLGPAVQVTGLSAPLLVCRA